MVAEEVAPGVRLTACRTCQARVFWAMTPAGKRMPIDAAAHPEGNLVTSRDKAGGVLAQPYDEAKHGRAIRRTSHFATCPEGTTWRKR